MRRAKVSCSIVTTSDGVRGDGGTFEMSDSGSGGQYEDVRQREESQLASGGVLGEKFVALDVPPVVEQFALQSMDGAEVAYRFGGTAATVTGSSGAFGTVTNGDQVTIAVDQALATTVTFQTGDTSLAAVVARINATLGAIVASDSGGQLKLTGAKTGGKEAADRAWQYGSIVLSGAALSKLGLTAGTTYGAGRDGSTDGRLFAEFPVSGAMRVTKIELSGSARIKTHAAGRNA